MSLRGKSKPTLWPYLAFLSQQPSASMSLFGEAEPRTPEIPHPPTEEIELVPLDSATLDYHLPDSQDSHHHQTTANHVSQVCNTKSRRPRCNVSRHILGKVFHARSHSLFSNFIIIQIFSFLGVWGHFGLSFFLDIWALYLPSKLRVWFSYMLKVIQD